MIRREYRLCSRHDDHGDHNYGDYNDHGDHNRDDDHDFSLSPSASVVTPRLALSSSGLILSS